jgi:uncharacterized membrane protein
MSIHDPIHMERRPGQQTQPSQSGPQGETDASAPHHGRNRRPVNVGSGERVASLAGGSLLALLGLRRRTLPGLVVAVAGGELVRRGISGHCNMYETLGVDTTRENAGPEDYFTRGIHIEQSCTINKDPKELYAFWHNFENLPTFMTYLQSVQVLDDKKSHWVAKGPAGHAVQWDAQIINDEPNQTIAWQSLEGAEVDHTGSVRFIPSKDRGTEVKVVLDYIPPGGRLGAAVAYLFGRSPSAEIKEDLRRFKQLMETGEIATTQGQPRGSCAR